MPWWRLRFGGFRTEQSTWIIPGGADIENAGGESSFPGYQAEWRNTFHLTKSTTLWTSLRRIGAVPANDNGGGVVPAYTELDASLVWPVRRDVDFSLTGRNLLHASHPEIGGLSVRREIQRTVEASFRLKL
jgi:iron complex outermembrane receptor protein